MPFPAPIHFQLARIFHELVSRDRGEGRATGQSQGIGSEAYLNSTSQGPIPEDARKDVHIRGRSRQFVKYPGLAKLIYECHMGQNQMIDPETWVDEHGDSLFRYALFRIQDAQVAEDLVQETFLAALRGKDSFAGRSSLRTWLFGILKHKIIDHIRKISRERPEEDIETLANLADKTFDEQGVWKSQPAKWTTDPELLFQQQEFWEMLQYCLSELPPRLNQVFTLRELDELSAEEVRKILQVSPTNGGVMLHRARMRLRKCLEISWFDNKD